jgi:MoaA/NifB/PqqE/SkfB family radical SAM enzyme
MPSLPFRVTFGLDLAKNFVRDAVDVRLREAPRLKPLILAYFVTFRCNLHCRYCEYTNNDFHKRHREADTRQAKEILRICRQGVPSVGFSGGEPLMREDIVELVAHARELGYAPISLFTNSLLLPEREGVLDYVDFLQISLDTLDEEKQDRINGKKGVGRRVKENIVRYARLQEKKGFRINVNCVAGPDNIEDAPALLDFVVENRVRFSIAPQLDDWGMPDQELVRGETYRRYTRMMEAMARLKRKGNTLVDIRPFLEHLATFKKMRCYPTVAPRVYADGSFIHPCPNRCREKTNVLAAGSWGELIREAELRNDSSAECTRPCFLPCYVETSLLVRHQFSLLSELGG